MTPDSSDVLAFGVMPDDISSAQDFVTVINFGDEERTVDLFGLFHPVLDMGLVEVGSGESAANPEG